MAEIPLFGQLEKAMKTVNQTVAQPDRARTVDRRFAPLAICLLLSVFGSHVLAQEEDPGWPQEFSNDHGTMTVYQPQIDSWEGYVSLEVRVAVVVTRTGSETPNLGALVITAETQTDHESRTVMLYNKKVKSARFPALDDAETKKIVELVESLVDQQPQLYSLDRLLANMLLTEAETSTTAVKTSPPLIFSSQRPAVLVMFDGEPIFSPIEGTELKYAVNTNWDCFFDPTNSIYYILNDSIWINAREYTGPYIPVEKFPKSLSDLPKVENWERVRENIPGKTGARDAIPAVYVATQPAELIITDGAPAIEKIPGTDLSWITNTESDLFMFGGDAQFYFLVSGRWFRAASLSGPWSFATDVLPGDFGLIPEDHPRASVLASVPGSAQANEAVLQAQIPQQASVHRDSVNVEVTYEGEPKFEPIESTTMYYAVNTPYTVIRSGPSYYCCHNGVWFVSSSPSGVWILCDNVPSTIYAIPSSSPVHHVTYVHVYHSSRTTIVFGYTSGYHGVYVSHGCVVYGTGYYYSPYVYWGHTYPVYYARPYSYGVAAYYNPYRGTYVRGGTVYGPYGGYGRGASYNPHTGAYVRGASAWGPYGGGGVARGYNPTTGVRGATRQGYNSYSNWGTSVASRGNQWVRTGHYSDSRGSVAGFETSKGKRGVAVRGDDHSGGVVKGKRNDLYVGRDGNVYKRSGDGWSKYDDKGWNKVEGPQDRARTQPDERQESGQRTREQASGTDRKRTQSANKSATGTRARSTTQTGWGDLKKASNTSAFHGVKRDAMARDRGNRNANAFKSARTSRSTRGRATRSRRGRSGRR